MSDSQLPLPTKTDVQFDEWSKQDLDCGHRLREAKRYANRLEWELNSLKERLATCSVAWAEAKAELASAQAWIERLQDGRTLTCVYCGHEYSPGTPAHGVGALTEHIKVCPRHPMRAYHDIFVKVKEVCDTHFNDSRFVEISKRLATLAFRAVSPSDVSTPPSLHEENCVLRSQVENADINLEQARPSPLWLRTGWKEPPASLVDETAES